MSSSRILVAFYSRTGTTKQVAEMIASELGADVEEIRDLKDRSGPLGFAVGGKDALFGKLTSIGPVGKPPSSYELAVVGTPVWANTMCPAVRTYLTEQKDSLPKAAFFLTTGGSGIEATFRKMEEVSGRSPVATLGLRQLDVHKGEHADRVKAFAEQVRAALGGAAV